jgi:hypothetical protein
LSEGQAWWYTSLIPVTWEAEVGEFLPETSLDKSIRPHLKNKLKKPKDWGMAQVVEHLPSKYWVLSQSLVLPEKKKKVVEWTTN